MYNASSVNEEETIRMELRDYQKSDVQRIHQTASLGIFSEQRTGKTPTAIIGMLSKCTRILVVCPNSLVYNWSAEFETWAGKDTTVITKMEIPKDHADIIIVNYEKLAPTKKHEGLYKALLKLKFDGIIVDEAHRIKNRDAAISKCLIHMAHKIPNRLALTGTPAHDRPEDVWNILHFIEPHVFTSYWDFVDTWCVMETVWTPKGGTTRPAGLLAAKRELFAEMLNKYAIMHKREEVMDWDTDQDIVDIKIPLNSTQAKYLQDLEQFFDCTDGTTTIEAKGVLDRLIRYRQICNAPAILSLKGKAPKVEWIKDFIKHSDDSTIIFSNSRKFLDVLDHELRKICTFDRIDGTISPIKRKEAVQKFQAKQIRVLLIQTQAGKEGLTLDQADSTIFCDVYPPMSDYLQAKDRAVPTDKSRVKNRTVYRLMMKDSFDETLYALVDNNINASDVINNFVKYIRRN